MIIHKMVKDSWGLYPRYLCNQAVEPTKCKLSHFWKNVTCKNCLKIRKKE